MLRSAHLKLIARHSVRHGIRGGAGLVAVFATLVLGLSLATCVLSPIENVEKMDSGMAERFSGHHFSDEQMAEARQLANRQVIKLGGTAINWAIDPSPEQSEYLTEDKPVLISAILVLLMLVTPLLSCLAGFNQTAGDISTKGLRFLLIRTERPNIFFGRFIGTFVFNAVVYAILFAILTIYCAIKIKVHPAGDMVGWLLQGYLRLVVFSLPYVAMCAWVSCLIDSSFGALVIALLCAYFIPFLVGVAGNINEHAHYLQYLTPWGYKYWLLQPIGAQFLGGIAIMAGFTVGLLYLGGRHFSKRDL
jgi:ABC-type transport system involved in multi-copper enzyme maturation permease subunit